MEGANESEKKLVACIGRWHGEIAKQLETPILPNEISPERKEEKLKEISRQQQQHSAASAAIAKLIRLRKRAA